MQRQRGHGPHHHRVGLHRNRVAAPSRAQPLRREEGGCHLCQQGSLFREEDAKAPCSSPSAATDPRPYIRRKHNRKPRLALAVDRQRHRPRGTDLRYQRDGLHQQRQHAAQTARPAPVQDIRRGIEGLLPLLHRHQTP